MGHDPVTIREAAQLEVLLFVALAFLGGLGIIWWGFQTYQFGRLIRDTPTEPVRSVAMGRTEVDGKARPSSKIFDQPFTDGQCVYADFTVREYKEYPNDDDKDDQWETVQSDTVSTPFYVDDGTGQILVEPNEDTIYEISDFHTREFEVGRGESGPAPVQEFQGSAGEESYPSEDVEHVTRGELGSVSGTSQPRKYRQEVIPTTDETYVFGGATRKDPDEVGPDEDSVYIDTDPSTGEFIISDADEFTLARGYTKRSIMYIVAGLISSAMILAVLAQILLTGPVFGIDEAMPWLHGWFL